MQIIVPFWFLIPIAIAIGWYIGARRSDYTDEASLIPFETRWKLLLLAWAVAAFATVLIEIPLLALFPLFPLGLLDMIGGQVGSRHEGGTGHDLGIGILPILVGAMTGGWLIYITITDAALITRRTFTFVVSYGVLCVLLVFNVVGCHRILSHIE